METARRFTLIDGLRGLAALAVVLYHAHAGGHLVETAAALPAVRVLSYGHLGVAVFFVLSGFVVAHSLHRARMTGSALGGFVLRRSLRLDPPYWVAIALCLLAASANGGARALPGAPALLAHLAYLQDLLGIAPISAVFWTPCLEIQFYLGYALVLLAGRNAPGEPLQGRRTAMLLAAAGAISLLWPLGLEPAVPEGLFLPLWHGFLLGVGAYWAWRQPGCRTFFLACAAAVLVGAWHTGSEFSAACAATAVLLYGASRTGHLVTAIDWRWLQGLGAVSYSLYLSHNPVTGAVFRVGFRLTGRTVLTELLWLAVAVLTCVAVAAVLWHLVERPSMALSRRVGRFARRGADPVVPAQGFAV